MMWWVFSLLEEIKKEKKSKICEDKMKTVDHGEVKAKDVAYNFIGVGNKQKIHSCKITSTAVMTHSWFGTTLK